MISKPAKPLARIVETPGPISARPLACALYHRVSTRDQDPTIARAELQAAARARGLTVAIDVEEVATGARNDRPGLQRVLQAAHKGEISTVLVWKLDRFGRSTVDLLNNIRALSNAGTRFICTTQGIDVRPSGADPMGALMITVLAAVAEFERAVTRERISLGLDAARRAGKHLGRPRRSGGPSGEEVVAMRAARLSWSEIAQRTGLTVGTARRRLAEVG